MDYFKFTNVMVSKEKAAAENALLQKKFLPKEWHHKGFEEILDGFGIPFRETEEGYLLGAAWTTNEIAQVCLESPAMLRLDPAIPFLADNRVGVEILSSPKIMEAFDQGYRWRIDSSMNMTTVLTFIAKTGGRMHVLPDRGDGYASASRSYITVWASFTSCTEQGTFCLSSSV